MAALAVQRKRDAYGRIYIGKYFRVTTWEISRQASQADLPCGFP